MSSRWPGWWRPGQEPSVSTYVDGIYQPTVFGALTSLANIQRIEVVKGPQGTLFGRNATGGLINIVTRDPSEHPELDLDASYGNFNTKRVTAYGTSGITTGVSADLALYYNDQSDGVGHNVATGDRLRATQSIDIRSKVLIDASDTTKIHLGGDYSHNRGYVGNNLGILPGSAAPDGSTHQPNFYDINTNIDPLNRNSTWQVNGKIEQQFRPFDLMAISAYTQTKDYENYDDDATPLPILNVVLSQKTKVFTQELQLVSKKGSPLTWIVGAFYYNSNARGTPTGTGLRGLAFGGGGINARGNLKTESVAVYGEATYEILPKLDLTVGGRYTRDHKILTGGFDATDINGNVLSTTPLAKASKTFSDPTYRAILDYHLTSTILTYASYSRGFKSGGFDTGFPNGVPFKPETLDAYELGVKSQFFDKRLTLNIAGFHYNYKDLQLPVLVNINGAVSQVTVNATSAKVNGVDLDGSFRLSHRLSANFGFGYLDSTYGKFPDAPCTARNAAAVTYQYVCDVSGNRTTNAPKFSANFGATYTLPTSVGDFALTGSYAYRSTFYFTPDDRFVQHGYGLVNGQLGWTPESSRFSVSLFVENLTNKKFTTAQFGQAGLPDEYIAGRPRFFGIEGRAKF